MLQNIKNLEIIAWWEWNIVFRSLSEYYELLKKNLLPSAKEVALSVI